MTIPANARETPKPPIAMLVSDIDGTLVTPDKSLTPRAIEAVARLAKAGVAFTLVSSRPPRGMAALARTLNVSLPLAAFNGATLVSPQLRVIRALHPSARAARAMLTLLAAEQVQAWIFADNAWFLRDPDGARVAHERHTVGFEPTVVDSFEPVIDRVDKIVGVCDDAALLDAVEAKARDLLGASAAVIRSQSYYLDVTHPLADKGAAVRDLSREAGVDLARTAVIGDMTNDIAMFKVAGFAVAMGQAPDAVKAEADAVTAPNTDDGFAKAVEDLILPRAQRPV